MVAFVNTDGQQLMPVNIQALDRRVYFRIDDTTSLGVLAEGHDDVAMSATHADTMYGNGWNVTVRGSSRRVDDDTLREQLTTPIGARPGPVATAPSSSRCSPAASTDGASTTPEVPEPAPCCS
ncbi:pyridoxamine 5'-phosphate oxidase family protein [Aeromicrobium sp. UC242_57]|uniref:pyridoxamine 5'-phosphate oxidase family protein n=1 Tax=Aeromicrobium sp. UC242_57 TaxID=3374624 RepID=UPI003793202D